MRRTISLLVAAALLLAATLPTLAHNLEVHPPGNTDNKENWVGGHAVPASGQGLFLTPFDTYLPAGHIKGLPHACRATRDNPSVVIFVAPPFGSCEHGVMP